MTDHDDVAQRAYYQPDPDAIEVRDTDDDDGLFRLRMPISSTLEARDGDEFDQNRLEGWARQINDGTVPVYGDHGQNLDLAGSRYSAFGKLGYYDDADVAEIDGRDGEYELVADTVVMDPDTLSEDTGSLRENLARLKAQVERGIPITQSVGWSDDVGDRDVPGGSDLLEGSIVGIPSDAHASSTNGAGVPAAARAALAAGADPEVLVDEFRAVVMGSEDANPEQRHLSEQQAEIAREVLDAYRGEQGNGSVENFEEWLWSAAYHQFDENEFHAAMTALQEFFRDHAPLDEPVDDRLAPYLDEKQAGESDEDGDDRDTEDTVTTDPESPDDESGDDRDETDGIDAEEFREQMLEMQRNQTETLNTLAEALREDDEDEDEDEDEEEDDEEGEDEESERTVTIDGEEVDAREAVEQLRADLDDADPASPSDDDDDEGGTRDEQPENQPADPKNLL